jgi:phosphatidylglycerol:prolipoprotein diacylglycerol transferase
MWPDLYTLPGNGMVLHTYGLCLVLAFSAAFVLVHVRAMKIGLLPDRLVGAYVCAAIGGMFGGRILYAVAVEPAELLRNPLSLLSLSGFAVYGGILGGVIAVGMYAAAAGIDRWKLADLAGPAVLIGMAVGRLGCFFAGCCHGAIAPISDHPFGLLPDSFPGQIWLDSHFPFVALQFESNTVTDPALLFEPLYPTQLWAVFALGTLSAVMAWQWTRRTFDGQTAALTLLLEPPTRMFIESFRADERGYVVSWAVSPEVAAWLPPGLSQAAGAHEGFIAGITTSQGIGIAMIAAGAVIYVVRRRAGRTADAPLPAGPGDLLDELV